MTSEEQCVSFAYKIIHDYCHLITEHRLKGYSPPIRQAITYINTDLAADLSLKSLAGQININASYLSTLFKKEVGMPLTEYVNRCRIDRAQKLLLITDLPSRRWLCSAAFLICSISAACSNATPASRQKAIKNPLTVRSVKCCGNHPI